MTACKKRILGVATIALFMSTISFAAEIDSVTPRDQELNNSRALINEIFNERLEEGIQKANAKLDDTENLEGTEFCNEEILYTELRKAIFQSFTASWGLKGYALDQQLRELLAENSYSLEFDESIYRDISYLEGFSLNLKKLSDVVNVNGHLIGLDKMGHFFAEGWQYFELSEYKISNLDHALAWGEKQEMGKFGYTTTGIFSYADLVANFNGWRFWNKVLLNNDDPLKGAVANFFSRPYVSCDVQLISSIKNRKIVKAWESNVQFDLADYLDGTWDEGNNSNRYADTDIREKVTTRIHEIDPNFTFPYDPEECVIAQKKYGIYGKRILHPQCLKAVN